MSDEERSEKEMLLFAPLYIVEEEREGERERKDEMGTEEEDKRKADISSHYERMSSFFLYPDPAAMKVDEPRTRERAKKKRSKDISPLELP